MTRLWSGPSRRAKCWLVESRACAGPAAQRPHVLVPNATKMDTAAIRRIAPVASAIYLAGFVIICGIVAVAFVADLRMDHNSVSEPTSTKTAAYQSHGKTLYVEPEVMM